MEVLLDRHLDRIHAVCRRITGSAQDADDATQEALLAIVRGLARFDGRSAFGTWVYRIATNASLDELRRRRRRPALHADRDDDDRAPSDQPDPLAHRRVDAVAERLAIDAALEDLAPEFRAAVVLRDVADLDYAEIAEVLDVPVGTVKSRIARGRSQLADALGNPGGGRERPTTTGTATPTDPPPAEPPDPLP